MEFSDMVAILALLISLISAWISYRAYRYTVDTKESEMRRFFSREKSEFLVRIEQAQKSFKQLDHQLTISLQEVTGATDSLQNSLSSEIDKLKSDLSHLEGCHRQAQSLWHETYEMNQDGFAHHKPRFFKLIKSDEEFVREASKRLESVKGKL